MPRRIILDAEKPKASVERVNAAPERKDLSGLPMLRFIAAICLVLCISALGEQSSQANSTHHQPNGKQTSTAQQPSDAKPPASPVPKRQISNAEVNADPSDNVHGKTEGETQNPPKITDWMMVGLTLVYVLVSTALLFAVKRQANIAEQQAIISKESADAAKASADALINIERPWLLVVDVNNIQYPDVIKSGESRVSGAAFVIKNFGKSPAWIASIGGNFVTINSLSDLPPKPVYRTTRDVRDQSIVIVPITVQAGDHYTFKVPHESNADIYSGELPRVLKQEIIWCVYGFVVYRDIFDEDRETGFCYVFTKGGTPPFQPADVGSLYAYHK